MTAIIFVPRPPSVREHAFVAATAAGRRLKISCATTADESPDEILRDIERSMVGGGRVAHAMAPPRSMPESPLETACKTAMIWLLVCMCAFLLLSACGAAFGFFDAVVPGFHPDSGWISTWLLRLALAGLVALPGVAAFVRCMHRRTVLRHGHSAC